MDEYMTPNEVAQILKVNEKLIEDCLHSGNIPGIKIGNLWRISKSKLEKWLESSMQIPTVPAKRVDVQKDSFKSDNVQAEKSNIGCVQKETVEPIRKYFTCDEVAEIFGVKKLTVWAWIREKKLKAIQTGKNYRVRPADIREFENARMTVCSLS